MSWLTAVLTSISYIPSFHVLDKFDFIRPAEFRGMPAQADTKEGALGSRLIVYSAFHEQICFKPNALLLAIFWYFMEWNPKYSITFLFVVIGMHSNILPVFVSWSGEKVVHILDNLTHTNRIFYMI